MIQNKENSRFKIISIYTFRKIKAGETEIARYSLGESGVWIDKSAIYIGRDCYANDPEYEN